jgi:hypothetical protein
MIVEFSPAPPRRHRHGLQRLYLFTDAASGIELGRWPLPADCAAHLVHSGRIAPDATLTFQSGAQVFESGTASELAMLAQPTT